MEQTDAELVQRSRHGDAAAFHALVDRHAAMLYRMAVSLVGNATDAQDVLQETFLGALQGLDKFEGRASFRTWVTHVLVRQAARHHRREAIRTTQPLDEQTRGPGRGASAQQQADLRMDLAAVLQTISPEHREMIVLRELEGLSYEEIAGVLDIPRGTVESRLYRARAALKEKLKGYLD